MLKKLPLLVLIALAALVALVGDAHANPGLTTLVSIDSAGNQVGGVQPGISGDGRFVAFTATHVFVHDRQTGTATSVSLPGYWPAISADGRFIAFTSFESNIVPNDTNDTADVFVHDRDTDADAIFDEPGVIATTRVSVSTLGAEGNGESCVATAGAGCLDISADGRFVAFNSLASNLVPGDTNNTTDIFVHDRQTGTTELVSVDSGGNQLGGVQPMTTANGRFIAFVSNGIWVRDRQASSTTRADVSSGGTPGSGFTVLPDISDNGRFVVFSSDAPDLVPNDTNGQRDVFLHDRDADSDGIFDEPGAIATALASVSTGGAQGNGTSNRPAISGNGRFVTFESFATNLVLGDTNTCPYIPDPGTCPDVFVHDRQTGITTRVSVGSAGVQANDRSCSFLAGSTVPRCLTMSADGRFVAFHSWASNLTSGDTNNDVDVFLHDLGDLDGDGDWDPFDPDADGDGVPGISEGQCGDAIDNDGNGLVNDGCPQVGASAESGPDCTNAIDDDGDGWINDGCPGATETNACGSNSLNPGSRPERIDGVFAGVDNDGDSLIDEALPPGSEDYDCDGDGFTASIEKFLSSAADTRTDQNPCPATGVVTPPPEGTGANDEDPDPWPPDADDDQDTDVGDLIKLFYGKVFTSAPGPPYQQRSDFDGDTDIDVGDIIIGFYGRILTRCA